MLTKPSAVVFIFYESPQKDICTLKIFSDFVAGCLDLITPKISSEFNPPQGLYRPLIIFPEYPKVLQTQVLDDAMIKCPWSFCPWLVKMYLIHVGPC